MKNIVIVGAGHAAAQAIATLRGNGFQGSLTLVGEEQLWPYERPSLSKSFLSGEMELDKLFIRPASFYMNHGVDARFGRRVESIDREAKRVHLDDATALAYDSLLLATGSRPRMLNVPGADLSGVYALRNAADVANIRRDLLPGARLVIIGGGYIGLEVTATARKLGVDVTLLEAADRLLSRITCPAVSAFFEDEHRRRGVRIVCKAKIQGLVGDRASRRVEAVVCEDGEYPADVVLVGIGVVAADELARGAGLTCENGIVVDCNSRTSDPNIYAAGDCTNHPSIHYRRQIRLESVDNAFTQATCAALNMLGMPTVHDKVPWFWSDQYDLKMIIVGLSEGHDMTVLRGSPGTRSFSVCYLRDGELIAVDTVNHLKDQMAARKLVADRAHPDVAKLADPAIALKECL